jgi:hypothetical protein
MYSSGAPARRTGAPGDAGTCNSSGCHNSFALNTGTGSVTIAGSSQYAPGETLEFTIRVAEENAMEFGSEVTALDVTGANVGTWDVSDSSIQFADGNPDYVTHLPSQLAAQEYTWTVLWTAPLAATGEIRIYAAGNAANSNNNAMGDWIYTSDHPMSMSTVTGVENDGASMGLKVVDVFPNPFVEKTTVSYTLESVTEVSFEIFDLTGRLVASESLGTQGPGLNKIIISANNLPTGVLLYRLHAGLASRTTKLVLVR